MKTIFVKLPFLFTCVYLNIVPMYTQSLSGKLNGDVKSYSNVYLAKINNPGFFYSGAEGIVIDSAGLNPDGTFEFPGFGSLDTAFVYRLNIAAKGEKPGQLIRDYTRNNYAFILNEKFQVYITGDIGSLFKTYQIQYSGIPSKSSSWLEHLRDAELDLFTLVETFVHELATLAGDSMSLEEAKFKLLSDMKNYFETRMQPLYEKIITESRDERLVSLALMEIEQLKRLSEHFEFYELYTVRKFTDIPRHPYIAWWDKMIQKQKDSFQAGSQAPDFKGWTPAGDSLSLYEMKGDLILIDFWASWCMPCRKENKETVLPLFNAYAGKGFNVFGVSSDDVEQSWLAAIKRDGLLWPQVNLSADSRPGIHKLYNVSGLPTTYLVDHTFKILAKDLRGLDLKLFVQDYFQK